VLAVSDLVELSQHFNLVLSNCGISKQMWVYDAEVQTELLNIMINTFRCDRQYWNHTSQSCQLSWLNCLFLINML